MNSQGHQVEKITLINSEQDSIVVYFKKVWRYKSLIVAFARRDLKVKYAQTWLGLGWTIIQPLVASLIYTVFFSLMVKVSTNETPYILFVLSGLSLWTLFSYIFSQGLGVLLGNQEIIHKMAFPKIVLPLSKVIVGMQEFFVSFLLLFIIWIAIGSPNTRVALIFLPIIGMALFSISLTLILLAISIKYRDMLHLGPFLIYFGIWVTPVFYPSTLIPAPYQTLIYLNPAAGMIDLFRWALGINFEFSMFFILDFAAILFLFVLSIFIFKSVEDKIVDNV